MPYYLITIRLQDGKKVQGIKVHKNTNIDAMYNFFYNQATAHYRRDLKDFDCVIIAKQSASYKKWIGAKRKNADDWMEEPPDTSLLIKQKSPRERPPSTNNWAENQQR